MKEDLVSVIVPIYKTEGYLNTCVESIVNQTYENLEIILIDDGSPDNCPQMCDAWAERDSRIKVIHKHNQGLGMARNTGIENATGAYIYFVDSDDFICPQTVEKAYRAIKSTDSDMALFGMQTVDENGARLRVYIPETDRTLFCGSEVQNILLPSVIDNRQREENIKNIPLSAWACLVSMELIEKNNWRFVSERTVISEDSYSLIWLYRYVQRAVIVREALYCYRKNDHSLTRTFRHDRAEKNRKFYRDCFQMAQAQGYGEEVLISISGLYLGMEIAAMKQIVTAKLPFREKKGQLMQQLNDPSLQMALKHTAQSRYGIKKKLLFRAMKHKNGMLCYLLCAAGTPQKNT